MADPPKTKQPNFPDKKNHSRQGRSMNGQYIAGKRLTHYFDHFKEKQSLSAVSIVTISVLNSVKLCNRYINSA